MATAEQYAKWIVDNQDKRGTPEFETVSQAYKLVRGSGSQPKETPSVGFNMGAAKDTAMDILSGRYGRDALRSVAYGALDMAQGAGQLVSNIVDPVLPGTAANYNAAMRDTERQYQEGRYSPNAPDIGRVTGAVITPMAASAGPAAATLPQRMIQSGKVGTALGVAAPVSPDDKNYFGTKAEQVVNSGVLSAIAPAVVEPVIKGVGSVVNKLTQVVRGAVNSLTGQASPQTIENTLKLEFQRGGVDWGKLSQEVRNGLVAEVQNAIKSGGTVNPESIRRLADFQTLGIKPLQGQITRDPAQFAREQNLARMEVGAPIAQRLGEQNQQLVGVLNQRPVSATGTDPYSTGQRVIQSLQAKDAPVKQAIDQAYSAARDNVGRAAPMDAKTFSDRANLALDEGMLGSYLPAEVRNILNGVSSGQIPFNVNTAVQMDRVLSAAQRAAGQGSPQALAISRVRDSLNAAPIENAAGEQAKAAFDAARGQAASRFATIERTPALGAALDDAVAPEKFVETFAIRGKVQDVANLMRNMEPGSRAEVRAGVIDWIKNQAVTGTEETAKFSQAALNKALKTIGDRKLELIFAGDMQALNRLRAAARVGALVQSPPVAAGVNYSGSGTTILDQIDRISRLPVVGALMGKPSDIVRATQVTQSLQQPIPVAPGAPLVSEELLRKLGIRGGLLAAPVAAGGLLTLNR